LGVKRKDQALLLFTSNDHLLIQSSTKDKAAQAMALGGKLWFDGYLTVMVKSFFQLL
jgi:hypothetical protein